MNRKQLKISLFFFGGLPTHQVNKNPTVLPNARSFPFAPVVTYQA